MKDFSKIAKPLTDLLVGAPKKSRKKAPDPNWKWGPEQEKAFGILEEKLTSAPILAYANYSLPFIRHTDASGDRLGAVLCQKQEGKVRVIAYASRALTKAERNYPAHKLEYLALKWAVTEKYHDYLWGHNFTVFTDNNPLTYVSTTAKLDATGHRWLAALAAYDFDIQYRPGSANQDADKLSRLPSMEYRHMSSDAIAAISKAATLTISWASVLCSVQQPLDKHGFEEDTPESIRNWRAIQRNDRVVGTVHRHITQAETIYKGKDPEVRTLLREREHLKLIRGAPYRVVTQNGEVKKQLVLPEEYRVQALKGLHDDMGHMGRDRTLDLARDRFFWPAMTTDVEKWVKRCVRCILRKTPTTGRAPLVSINPFVTSPRRSL